MGNWTSAAITFPGKSGIGTAIDAAVNNKKNAMNICPAFTLFPHLLYVFHP